MQRETMQDLPIEWRNRQTPTVLVVDDTPDNLVLVSELLGDSYRVKVANSGARALKAAQTDPVPDLVLLDIMMPEMDGYEVCSQLKAAAATRDIPIIFLTARADSDGKLWVTGTYQHPYFRPVLDQVPARRNVAFAFGKDTPEDKGADNWVEASDHAAFHRAGLPFLYFGVNYHTDYHRPSDDFEKVVPATFQSSTELAIEGFRALDQWLDQ